MNKFTMLRQKVSVFCTPKKIKSLSAFFIFVIRHSIATESMISEQKCLESRLAVECYSPPSTSFTIAVPTPVRLSPATNPAAIGKTSFWNVFPKILEPTSASRAPKQREMLFQAGITNAKPILTGLGIKRVYLKEYSGV